MKHRVRLMSLLLIIAVSCTGCGGCGSADDDTVANADNVIENEVNTDKTDVVVDSTTNADVNDVVDNDVENTTPEDIPPIDAKDPEVDEDVSLLDESTAGTYYIIDEDQSVYASADESSEVVDTYTVDTEITVSGMWGDTGMFQVVDADGNVIGYVHSGYCDTIKGGYVVDEDTAIPSVDETKPSEDKKEDEKEDSKSPYAGEDWYESLTDEEKAFIDAPLTDVIGGGDSGTGSSGSNDGPGTPGNWGSWADGFDTGSGSGDVIIDDSPHLGDGSGLQSGVVVN